MSICYLINLFNFMLGCGLPTHIKAIFDLIDLRYHTGSVLAQALNP